jgi:hypothetical protein
MRQLQSKEGKKRKAAVEKLSRKSQKPEVIDALLKAAVDLTYPVREAAEEALGKADAALVAERLNTLIPFFLSALKSSDLGNRIGAAKLLGSADRSQVCEQLMASLSDDNHHVRKEATSSLARLGVLEAEPALIPLLQDYCPDVRKVVVGILQQIATRTAKRALLRGLRDEDQSVRWACRDALQAIDPNWRKSEEAKETLPYMREVFDPTMREKIWQSIFLRDVTYRKAVEEEERGSGYRTMWETNAELELRTKREIIESAADFLKETDDRLAVELLREALKDPEIIELSRPKGVFMGLLPTSKIRKVLESLGVYDA